jgi:hypothetical protein
MGIMNYQHVGGKGHKPAFFRKSNNKYVNISAYSKLVNARIEDCPSSNATKNESI